MALKIQKNSLARKESANKFAYETRHYKTKPNVIYLKGPKDRLLMMTE